MISLRVAAFMALSRRPARHLAHFSGARTPALAPFGALLDARTMPKAPDCSVTLADVTIRDVTKYESVYLKLQPDWEEGEDGPPMIVTRPGAAVEPATDTEDCRDTSPSVEALRSEEEPPAFPRV